MTEKWEFFKVSRERQTEIFSSLFDSIGEGKLETEKDMLEYAYKTYRGNELLLAMNICGYIKGLTSGLDYKSCKGVDE